MAAYNNNVIQRWYQDNIDLVKCIFHDKEIDFDKSAYTWLFIKDFDLPKDWTPNYSNLLIKLPGLNGGIETPPFGFYIDKRLKTVSGKTPAHYFEGGFVNDLSQKGYSYLSIHIQSWNPSLTILDGDNLLVVLNIIYQRMQYFAK